MNARTISKQPDTTVIIQLPQRLYQRVERAAHASGCAATQLIVATLENRLPLLPASLPPALSEDLQGWTLLDDAALRALAEAVLPAKQQRRYTALLRKADAGRLNAREQTEWTALQQDYLRCSQNKAKALFLLAQRRKTAARNGATA